MTSCALFASTLSKEFISTTTLGIYQLGLKATIENYQFSPPEHVAVSARIEAIFLLLHRRVTEMRSAANETSYRGCVLSLHQSQPGYYPPQLPR